MHSSMELISGFKKYEFLHALIVKQQQQKQTKTSTQKVTRSYYQSAFLIN